MVIGPGLGGVLIGVLGVGAAYAIDAVSCLAMVGAVVVMAPQPPQTDGADHLAGAALDRRGAALRARQPGARRLVRDRPRGHDLRHAARAVRRARGQRLPRGRRGDGPALRGGVGGRDRRGADHRLDRARAAPGADRDLGGRRLGRGDRRSSASSARCGRPPCCSRSPAPPTASAPSAAASINQMVTPDAMRGRMSSVFSLVVTSGPRLGDVESGTVAGAHEPALLGRLRRPGLHRGRRRRRRGLPGARALRRRGGPGGSRRGAAPAPAPAG